MTRLVDLSAVELLANLESHEVSARELAQAYLDRIEQIDGKVGAYLNVFADEALAHAADIDQRRASGQPVGRLGGLPIGLKDILCTRGQPTTCASRMLERFAPPFDATVVRKLREADAVILGKLNLDEFAMGGSTENSALGVTRNPWNLGCIPGGSSGGSAACVAASLAPWSLGTDTGGSIRQPAALCGVVGLKPTYGRVSRFGLVAFASSLDQCGPLTRTAEDAALLMEVVSGHDPRDATSIDREAPAYFASVREPLAGLTLGVVDEHFGPGLDSEVADAVQESIRVFESLGAKVKRVTLPHSRYSIACYYVIAPSEASSNLARYDGVHYGHRADVAKITAELSAEAQALRAAGDEAAVAQLDTPLVRMYRQSRSEGFGAEVKRRIMLGAYALSAGYYDAYYLKALKVRRLIRQDFDAAFEDVDLIIGPVTATPAFPIGSKNDDPLAMYLVDLYTVSANLAGICGLSMPCGFSAGGLPIGVQLQGKPFAEETLLRAAHMHQQATDWHRARPKLA